MKRIFLLALLVLLLLVACQQDPAEEVCFDDTCFQVEVVDTNEARMKGLMHREHLDQDRGMLFVFEQSGRYPFWMKNTLIPLDMIWMDADKRVVTIKHNAMPCEQDPCESYDPGAQALYVLEINGGLASETGIEKGDVASFG